MCARPFALRVSNELAFHPLTPPPAFPDPFALVCHWKEKTEKGGEETKGERSEHNGKSLEESGERKDIGDSLSCLKSEVSRAGQHPIS